MKTRKGYLKKRGKTWYACYTVNGKKFVTTTHKTDQEEARKVLDAIMEPLLIEDRIKTLQNVSDKIRNLKNDKAAIEAKQSPPPTILASWELFKNSPERQECGEATLAQYESHFDQFSRWLAAEYSDITALAQVSESVAKAYATHLKGRHLSPNRYNKHIQFLRLLFRILKRDCGITDNWWLAIARKKRAKGNRRRELTIEELRRVCAHTEGDYRLLFALGIYTGMRLGDCATLRWGEVDIARGFITRLPNKIRNYDNAEPVKVPIHPTLRAMLLEIPQADRRDYVLPKIAALYQTAPIELNRTLQDHFTECGIKTHRPGTGEGTDKRAVVEVGFHSLRHSFVSMLAEAGAPRGAVQNMVGHTNEAMTAHYDHAEHAAAKLAAVATLPAVTGDPVKALPVAGSPRTVDAGAVRVRLEAMTAKTWKAVRDELMTLTAEGGAL